MAFANDGYHYKSHFYDEKNSYFFADATGTTVLISTILFK